MCLLAAVAMPARSDLRPVDAVALLLGFVTVSVADLWLAIAGVAGLFVALAGAGQLFRRTSAQVSCLAAGASAGFASVLLIEQGAPAVASVGLCGAIAATAFELARRRTFQSSTRLRDEALSALSLAAFALAAAPTVAAGWQSALTLNRAEVAGEPAVMAGWVWMFIAATTAGGIARTLWMRR